MQSLQLAVCLRVLDALRKVPDAFKASFVVTAQPVADPVQAMSLDVDSLVHGHVAHANHAYCNHLGSNLVIFSFLHAFSSSARFVLFMHPCDEI